MSLDAMSVTRFTGVAAEEMTASVAAVTTLKLAGAEIAPAANQADSTAADVAGVVADLNALLAKLKAAGLMAADA